MPTVRCRSWTRRAYMWTPCSRRDPEAALPSIRLRRHVVSAPGAGAGAPVNGGSPPGGPMSSRSVVVAGLVPLVAATLVAQSLPRSQPAIINIYREIEKPNHAVAHEATEERWADFNRRSGYPTSYFGLVAASGVPEIWLISSFENMEG